MTAVLPYKFLLVGLMNLIIGIFCGIWFVFYPKPFIRHFGEIKNEANLEPENGRHKIKNRPGSSRPFNAYSDLVQIRMIHSGQYQKPVFDRYHACSGILARRPARSLSPGY